MGLFLLGFFGMLLLGGLLAIIGRLIATVLGTLLGLGRGVYNVCTGKQAGRELTNAEWAASINAEEQAARRR